MNKEQFKTAAKALGWEEDAFGHLKSPSGNSRIKFQANSLRLERKFRPEPSFGYTPPTQWINVVSDYYKNITLTPDNRPIIKGRVLKDMHPSSKPPIPQTTQYRGKNGNTYYKPTTAKIVDLIHHSEGFCLACGHIETTEPDTHKAQCPSGGKPNFYGGEELALRWV